MQATLSRKPNQGQTPEDSWPRKVQPGRAVVTVYRRKTPSGNYGYMVANYVEDGTRRLDSYGTEAEALDAADTLAKRLDKRDYVAASMTRDQAIEYADSNTSLKPFNVTVRDATNTVAQCLKEVGTLANIHAAVKFFNAKHKPTTKKTVAAVVKEMLDIKRARTKKGRPASERYINDLDGRLDRFATDCQKDACDVTTSDIQDWLDGLKLAPQSYRNYRTVLHTLFKYAVAKSYALENPVKGSERIDVSDGEVEVFTPSEIARLLDAAKAQYPDYLPCLAIGAFAGLRSAEIERLNWEDVDLAARHIVVGASQAKTASRRIVPIHDNLAEWLRDYANCEGRIWKSSAVLFYKRQEATAAATAGKADEAKGIKGQKAVAWKGNGLRHSYASYRFAQTTDAGKVAGELGNSTAVVHKHYRELVKPADAVKWFAVKPETPANVVAIPSPATA